MAFSETFKNVRGRLAPMSGSPGAKRIPAPSAKDLAGALVESFPLVIQSQSTARKIVAAVIENMGRILAAEGTLVLRGVGTLRVVGVENAATEKRRRLVVRTSWSMLSRLNPSYPKLRGRREVSCD